MKNLSFIYCVLALLFISSCASTKNEKPIITGEYTWNQWQNSAGWKSYSADEYEPGNYLAEQISIISNSNNDVSFILFAGSWCHDSEMELPKIYKLFDIANIPLNKIKLFGVDRNKLEPSGKAESFKILRVPTLIILNKDKEAGRIVEFPKTSWEEDIFIILTKI